jgi:hypothetical protein
MQVPVPVVVLFAGFMRVDESPNIDPSCLSAGTVTFVHRYQYVLRVTEELVVI